MGQVRQSDSHLRLLITLYSCSQKKMKYSMLTGSFSYDGINEFLRDLSYGKGRTNPVRGAKMPKIATVEGWDGKDGELPEEEDIDLSDVDLDDHDEL